MAIPRVVGGVLIAVAVTVAVVALLFPWLDFGTSFGFNQPNKSTGVCPLGYTAEQVQFVELPPDHPKVIGLKANNNQKVKLIVYDAQIWTADDDNPKAEAFAVNEDGYIIAVGSSGQIMDLFQVNYTQVVNLKRQHVTPGLIDAHVHLMMAGHKIEITNLKEISSQQEFMRTIEAVSRYPNHEGRWFLGSGWDETKFDNGQLPDKSWLDAYLRRSPAIMLRYDFHMAVANSVALKLANITKDTSDPQGGKIDRDENGYPTGILREHAIDLVQSVIPQPTPDLLNRFFMNSQRIALENGVTCVHDMDIGWNRGQPDNFVQLQNFFFPLADQEELKLRVNLAINMKYFSQLTQFIQQREQSQQTQHKSLKLFWGSIKVFADGSLGSGTALMRKPYQINKQSASTGVQLVEWSELKQLILAANGEGMPVVVHAIGDEAVEQVTEIMAQCSELIGKGASVMNRIEHAQHISGGSVAQKIAEHNIGITVNPQHMFGDYEVVEEIGDEQLIKYTHAYNTLFQHNVTLALTSDWPVVDLKPWEMIYAAVFRKPAYQNEKDFKPSQQGLDPEVALKGVTKNAAKLLGLGNLIGSIKVGLKADFVVLDQSPIFRTSQQQLPRTIHTFIDGNCVYGCNQINQ